MSSRLEYKYLVPNELLSTIRSEIRPFVRFDRFALLREQKEYTIRSVYFDTPIMSCYDEKIEGIRVRKKYRIRGYNNLDETDIIFLEIKRKYKNFISKNRAPLHNNNLESLFVSRDIDKYVLPFGENGKAKSDAQRFLYHYYRRKLSPKILIVYEREAFYSKFNDSIRITFDKNLRSAPFTFHNKFSNGYKLKNTFNRHFILELKFDHGLPAWIKHTVGKYQLPRLALSKYTMCLDSIGIMRNKQPKVGPFSYDYRFRLN